MISIIVDKRGAAGTDAETFEAMPEWLAFRSAVSMQSRRLGVQLVVLEPVAAPMKQSTEGAGSVAAGAENPRGSFGQYISPELVLVVVLLVAGLIYWACNDMSAAPLKNDFSAASPLKVSGQPSEQMVQAERMAEGQAFTKKLLDVMLHGYPVKQLLTVDASGDSRGKYRCIVVGETDGLRGDAVLDTPEAACYHAAVMYKDMRLISDSHKHTEKK